MSLFSIYEIILKWKRKSYALSIELNGAVFMGVEIDQHYKEKHPDISDELILAMLEQVVDGKKVDPEDETDEGGSSTSKSSSWSSRAAVTA